ncbi:MAG: SLBB domain-containing protein [Candidatus Poribacteria bacterium]|nr:SLBB domain-containing protein [Candidatus Poribacteria bacterium]
MNILPLRGHLLSDIRRYLKRTLSKFALFLLIIQIGSPVSLFAEDSPPDNPTTHTETTPKAQNPSEQLSTYRLQIGDSFVVTVDGYPEYSMDRIPVPIQQDGYVSYPLIGLIKVTGLTVSELQAEMQSAFSAQLPTARVFVTLMEPKRTILVFGAVTMRGRGNLHVFEVGQVYLLQALASADIIYETADLKNIYIWRDGKLHQKVDYLQLIDDGGPDIPLEDHDTIFVPSIYQQRSVRVIGAVTSPGVYRITVPEVPAIQVLNLAGGSRSEFADLNNAEIITSEARILVDLSEEDTTVMLSPGDTLYIPLADAKISVTGAVKKPGQYVITEPVPLREAIVMAGGFDETRANPKKCILTRADGTEEEINFDLVQSEIYLHPKDQFRVRERLRLDWRIITSTISFVNLLFNILAR